MPIRPENRARYPKDWKAIGLRIRNERAAGQCECAGECGVDHEKEWDESGIDLCDFHGARCPARNGTSHPITQGKVVLTVAHLPGREIEQCGDDDLKAMCQRCHNRMDAPMRRQGIQQRAKAKLATGDLLQSLTELKS